MAIRLVAEASAGATSSGAAVSTAGVDTTGATLLVAICTNAQAVATVTLSDNKGNTWTALTAQAVAAQSRCQMFYVANPTVGSGHTATIAALASASPALIFLAFDGIATASPFDQENGASASGSQASLATGSITPTTDGQLVVAGVSRTSTGAATVDSPYGLTKAVTFSGGAHFAVDGAYAIQGTAAATNPSFAFTSTSSNPSAVIASFKAAASGSSGGAYAFAG